MCLSSCCYKTTTTINLSLSSSISFYSLINHNVRVQFACFVDFQFSAKCTFLKKIYKINLTNLVVLYLNCSAHVPYKRKTSNQNLTNSAIEDESHRYMCLVWIGSVGKSIFTGRLEGFLWGGRAESDRFYGVSCRGHAIVSGWKCP